MKAPIYHQTGNTPDCPGNVDGATGPDTRPIERGAWQTPRLYQLDVGAGTENSPRGGPVDAMIWDIS